MSKKEKLAVKGYIGEKDGRVYYHTEGGVYRLHKTSVLDRYSGYTNGVWDCSIELWNREVCKVLGFSPLLIEGPVRPTKRSSAQPRYQR